MSQSVSMPEDSEQFIPFTARVMAAMRAKETARPDRLFNDFFAAQFAGEEAFTFLEQKSRLTSKLNKICCYLSR